MPGIGESGNYPTFVPGAQAKEAAQRKRERLAQAERDRQQTGGRYDADGKAVATDMTVRVAPPPGAAEWNKRAFANTPPHASLREAGASGGATAAAPPAPATRPRHEGVGSLEELLAQERREGAAYAEREIAAKLQHTIKVTDLVHTTAAGIEYCELVEKYHGSHPKLPAVVAAVAGLRRQFQDAVRAFSATQRAVKAVMTEMQKTGGAEIPDLPKLWASMGEASRHFDAAASLSAACKFDEARAELAMGDNALVLGSSTVSLQNELNTADAAFWEKTISFAQSECEITLTILGGAGGRVASLAAGFMKISIKGAGAVSSHFNGIDTDVTIGSLAVETVMEIVSYYRVDLIGKLAEREPIKGLVAKALERVPSEKVHKVVAKLGVILWDLIKGTVNKVGEIYWRGHGRETKRATAVAGDVLFEALRDRLAEDGGEHFVAAAIHL